MNIIDELVDLARLAYKTDPSAADELITKIIANTSEYKLGRVLSMEIARLKCDKTSTNVEELQTQVKSLQAQVDSLQSDAEKEEESETQTEKLKSLLEEAKDVVGLIDPDLYNAIDEALEEKEDLLESSNDNG